MFDAFKYNNGKISLHDVNLLSIEEFKKILDADKNSDKKLAFKIFTFLYLYCDVRSYINKEGYNEVDAKAEAKKKAKLPEDWVPDADVKAAIEVYKTFPNPLKREIYISLKRSFRSAGRVIEKSRELLEELINKEDATSEDIKTCQTSLEQILDLATMLPEKLKKLAEAENMIESEDVKIRGGSKLTTSHDPDNDE